VLKNKSYPPGYLKAETMQTMWTVQPGTTRNWGRGDGYGMGWVVVPSRQEYGGGDVQAFTVGHTGGAVGASSVLLVVPNEVPYPAAIPLDSTSTHHRPSVPNSLSVSSSLESGVPQRSDICIPCGFTVASIMNLGDVGLHRLAMDIAALFCEMWSQINKIFFIYWERCLIGGITMFSLLIWWHSHLRMQYDVKGSMLTQETVMTLYSHKTSLADWKQ
jgi:hypothetical protein